MKIDFHGKWSYFVPCSTTVTAKKKKYESLQTSTGNPISAIVNVCRLKFKGKNKLLTPFFVCVYVLLINQIKLLFTIYTLNIQLYVFFLVCVAFEYHFIVDWFLVLHNIRNNIFFYTILMPAWLVFYVICFQISWAFSLFYDSFF